MCIRDRSTGSIRVRRTPRPSVCERVRRDRRRCVCSSFIRLHLRRLLRPKLQPHAAESKRHCSTARAGDELERRHRQQLGECDRIGVSKRHTRERHGWRDRRQRRGVCRCHSRTSTRHRDCRSSSRQSRPPSSRGRRGTCPPPRGAAPARRRSRPPPPSARPPAAAAPSAPPAAPSARARRRRSRRRAA